MIVVKLIGGLGNQLFQYAAGRALADFHNTDLYLDTSFLSVNPNGAYTKRDYDLHAFSIRATIADKTVLQNFDFESSRLLNKLKNIFPSYFSRVIFNEAQSYFNRQFFKLPANTYLNGYWQSEEYFLPSKNKIKDDFKLANPPSEKYQSLLLQIKSRKSISIHVRRGDYVSLNSANSFHGVLNKDYYQRAFEHFEEINSDFKYFVFSDDLNWCEQHLDFLGDVCFVDGSSLMLSAQEELLLMSNCSNHIIANSSFSWWGAWLNANPEKIVVMPQNWFTNVKSKTINIVPNNWLTR